MHVADRPLGDATRGVDVLIQERGRRRQDGGDVVETFHLNILRQSVLLVHIDTQESSHRRSVLGAAEALDRHVARRLTLGVGIEIILHPRAERIDILLLRLGITGRRHQTPSQLAQDLLPDLRVLRGRLEVHAVQGQAAGPGSRIMAADAVAVQHRAVLIRPACGRRRGGRSLPHRPILHNRQRGAQNHRSTRPKKTLHILQPVVLSTICSRMIIIGSPPLLAQKALNCQGSESATLKGVFRTANGTG